jgi:hypothetical protein
MSGWSCRHEREVQQAASSGRWTSALREHASTCPSCREVATVTASLQGEAARVPHRVAPGILWAKARHRRRERAETLASRILTGGQIAIGVAGTGVVAYLGARLDLWAWLEVHPWGPMFLGVTGLLFVGGLAALRRITRDV